MRSVMLLFFVHQLGCAVLNTLLSEFSDASRSSSLGMPLEFHLRAKKVLEQNGGLLKIFNISVQVRHHGFNQPWYMLLVNYATVSMDSKFYNERQCSANLGSHKRTYGDWCSTKVF